MRPVPQNLAVDLQVPRHGHQPCALLFRWIDGVEREREAIIHGCAHATHATRDEKGREKTIIHGCSRTHARTQRNATQRTERPHAHGDAGDGVEERGLLVQHGPHQVRPCCCWCACVRVCEKESVGNGVWWVGGWVGGAAGRASASLFGEGGGVEEDGSLVQGEAPTPTHTLLHTPPAPNSTHDSAGLQANFLFFS